MCSVINKFSLFVASCVAISLLACDSQGKREKEAAESLVEQVNVNLEQERYEEALELIDSINKAFPQQIESRRAVMPLRVKAMKGFSEQRLAQTDSLVTVLQMMIAEFDGKMHHVKGDADLDGYYVVESVYNPDFSSSTGIQVRVSDLDYSFYIVAASDRKKIGVRQIALSTPDASKESKSIPENSERMGDTDAFGSDVASFRTEEVADLAAWATENAPQINRLLIKGALGDVEVKFSPAQAEAIATAWKFADIASRLQQAMRLKQKLEKQLILARDQELNLE